MRQQLRILLVSDHGYLPDRTGGKEVSTHELACRYARDGHNVTVLCSDQIPGYRHGSIPGAVRYMKSRILRRLFEKDVKYKICRSNDVQRTMRHLVNEHGFDLTVLQFDVPHRNIDFNLPSGTRYVIYFRDARDIQGMGPDSFPADVALVANSGYTSTQVAKQTGRNVTRIIPYVEKSRYVTNPGGSFVTFINPVKVKGVELAIQIAETCPELRFMFVEGWPLSRRARQELKKRFRYAPNIKYHNRSSSMRSIYSQTRVLLVPSQWEESWGRVVTESQFSAIPVLASDIGGLPESVGRGGILLSPSEPATIWADVLRKLYAPGLHEKISILARAQAEAYWTVGQSQPRALLDCCWSAHENLLGSGSIDRNFNP